MISGRRSAPVLLVGLGAALVIGAASAGGSPPSPKGLLLWNTLGSAYAIRHSLVGPNLVWFNCRNRRIPHFGPRCSIDIRGKLAFVKGPGGAPAATIGGGPYFSEARVHTALLLKSILNPEHGAVEAWYRQTKDPESFVDNPHRIFHGPYGLAGPDDVMLFAQDRLDSGDPRLHFVVSFTGNSPAPVVWAHSLADRRIGYPISNLNGQWIHVAGVWDRKGIAGTRDTVRLYVNGQVVAASKSKRWGRTPCGGSRHKRRCFFDVVGCNDTCAGTFGVAGLKLWNYAKTDF